MILNKIEFKIIQRTKSNRRKVSFCYQTNKKIVYLERNVDSFRHIGMFVYFQVYLQPINIIISF